MKYILLLRGINISGKNKISMSELKEELEKIGYKNVLTYLNSGNVIFDYDIGAKEVILNKIKLMIKNKFNLEIPIYIMTSLELKDILNNSPKWWGSNDKKIYDNIIFIVPPTKYNEVFESVGTSTINIDKIQEYNNIIFWSYDLDNYRKSNWWIKTAKEPIKDKITIRTANTIKNILKLCDKD